MCLPCTERVILSASEGPQQCEGLPCGLNFSPPSILLCPRARGIYLVLRGVILSASEGPPQCPSLPCGLKLFSPPSILLFLAPASYTFLETVLASIAASTDFDPRDMAARACRCAQESSAETLVSAVFQAKSSHL